MLTLIMHLPIVGSYLFDAMAVLTFTANLPMAYFGRLSRDFPKRDSTLGQQPKLTFAYQEKLAEKSG
jgi:hypothetical protein